MNGLMYKWMNEWTIKEWVNEEKTIGKFLKWEKKIVKESNEWEKFGIQQFCKEIQSFRDVYWSSKEIKFPISRDMWMEML